MSDIEQLDACHCLFKCANVTAKVAGGDAASAGVEELGGLLAGA